MTIPWHDCSTLPGGRACRRRFVGNGCPRSAGHVGRHSRRDDLPHPHGSSGCVRPVVADLPFMSYQISPTQALENAGTANERERLPHAVKLEGGIRSAAAVEAVTRADIPLVGHIGFTPQSVRRLGGYKVHRDADALIGRRQSDRTGRSVCHRVGVRTGGTSRPRHRSGKRRRPSASERGPTATVRYW
jgi:hypothetical protein